MGNRVSSPARLAKAKSDAIDLQLKLEAHSRLRKEYKVLLLGSPESGKSTIIKQMKITCQNGFTDDELMTYRQTIYQNILDSAQAIVHAICEIGLDCVDPNNRVNASRIIDFRIDSSFNSIFSSEIAEAIHQLWKDPIIPKLMEHSSEFHLMDSAVYFLTNVRRIGSPNYRPTENDVLQAHQESTGITEARLTMGQFRIHVIDVGGQHTNRRKWIHCFENVTSVIFCASLIEYDQVSLDEKNQNRMAESIVLFESVINSRWFLRTSIILFLTKIDIFKTKLPKVPLERYFPEYSGGADINKAAKYILWKYIQTNCARLPVYPHLTQETDPTNIRLVFAAVKETTLQNARKDSSIQ